MVEKQEKRTIPLLEIVELCRGESENKRDAASNLPPILSPYMAHNSPVSIWLSSSRLILSIHYIKNIPYDAVYCFITVVSIYVEPVYL